ncbi:hypothetical protein ACFE04_030041 [Oxalis oulophora]
MDKYMIIDELGSGAFGVVYRAVERKSGQKVAIKQLKQHFSSWEQCLNLTEVKSLMNIKHTNIINLRDAFLGNSEFFLVFDFMDNNLLQIMERRRRYPFSEQVIKDYCFQLFLGLAHMHNVGYFHRDLKPENMLVNKENVVKIADFGFATEINSDSSFYAEYCGTRWYRAPEVIMTGGTYCPKADMWAMGAIMAELFNLAPLFPGKDEADQLVQICKVIGQPTLESWPEGVHLANNGIPFFQFPAFRGESLSELIPLASKDAINLIGSILTWNPSKRPTAIEALKHPFFRSCYKLLKTNEEAMELSKGSRVYTPPHARTGRVPPRMDYGVIGTRKQSYCS